MAAGWLYYHKYPPKGRCPNPDCPTQSKRHYATRIGRASNGEDFWRVFCTATARSGAGPVITPLYREPSR